MDRAAPRRPPAVLGPAERAERDLYAIRRRQRLKDELREWEASGIDIVPW